MPVRAEHPDEKALRIKKRVNELTPAVSGSDGGGA
jgi:hypothetical protein